MNILLSVFLIVMGLALALLLLVLLLPFRLIVDSAKGVYCFQWRFLMSVRWLPEESPDTLLLDAPFYHRKISLGSIVGEPSLAVSKTPRRKKPAQKKRAASGVPPLRIAFSVLRSFRVRHFQLWLDTGDFVHNAMLFPVLWHLRRRGLRIHLNFMGMNEVAFCIENSLGRMAMAVFSTYISHKNR